MAFTKITNAGFGLTTGTLVGVAASFSSTVSVGGTLTYEDVTNVDSVGLITARNGIEVTDKGVQVGTGATVDSAAANTLTFLTNGSERVRVTSDGRVGINTDMGGAPASLYPFSVYRSTGTGYVYTETAQSGASAGLRAKAGTADFTIFTTQGTGQLAVYDNTNTAERLRIDSSGRLMLGTTTEGYSSGDDLTIATSGHTGITLRSGTTSEGAVYFSDATSGGGEYIGSLVYSHNTNNMIFTANGAERMRIASDGDVGVGLASPNSRLHVKGGSDSTDNLLLTLQSNGVANDGSLSTGLRLINSTSDSSIHGGEIRAIRSSASAAALTFSTYNGTSIAEAVRIDSSGNFGVGTASPGYKIEVTQGSGNSVARFTGANSANLVFRNATSNVFELNAGGSNDELSFGTAGNNERLRISDTGKVQVRGTRGGSLQPSDNDTLELYTSASNGAANTGSGLTFFNNDGNGYEIGGTIQVAKENGSINNTAGYMRFSTRANASDPAERMRITSGGEVLIARTSASISNVGHYFLPGGAFNHTRSGDTVGVINRLASDGTLIGFRQADSLEGSISVSGSTVSYNGGHLARWSQLPSGAARTEILRGSVLSNLDEMCEWGDENNEQLNRMKVSDVEGDINVSGVFQAWDDDDDTYTNDFYCAMTGDFVIRIAQGTTVARGDLLMSAGDGTAKPQDDDIVRSKTVAKVTSTTVSDAYSDGSYCVPCVLMAC